ncbi:hypothetical protein CJ030_MR1G020593 [Morella rubra]|uniref:DUF8040 domain-containing protein n=1 Tax=Morella rubra TaxID=262757 RepID=A0A6A1WP83_9ROSI|nr:hypothetical protein CJ030_MR1G020593 [Morella rubra]
MDSDHEAVESSASDTSCSEELAIGDTSSDGSETSNEDNRLAMKLIERVCKKRLVARSKIPRHASILTGAIHMKEILENPDGTVCRQLFRISQSTFISVCRALRVRGELEDENVSVEEAFGMFAWTVGHKATGHFFPHSTDTVDQHVKRVARALSKMSKDVIRPRHIEGVHPYVQGNPKYYPWFQVFYI